MAHAPDPVPRPTHADPASVELLVLDVDGVLTDGSIFIDHAGNEIKRFHASDGVALRVWRSLGLASAVITGRSGSAVVHRLTDLGVAHIITGSHDKAPALAELARRTSITPARMAYLGDDWPDLPVLRRVGYPMAVANAAPEVKAAATLVTTRPGGRGAVREAIEHLLRAKGLLNRALALFD